MENRKLKIVKKREPDASRFDLQFSLFHFPFSNFHFPFSIFLFP